MLRTLKTTRIVCLLLKTKSIKNYHKLLLVVLKIKYNLRRLKYQAKFLLQYVICYHSHLQSQGYQYNLHKLILNGNTKDSIYKAKANRDKQIITNFHKSKIFNNYKDKRVLIFTPLKQR